MQILKRGTFTWNPETNEIGTNGFGILIDSGKGEKLETFLTPQAYMQMFLAATTVYCGPLDMIPKKRFHGKSIKKKSAKHRPCKKKEDH
jgi:hypothetical protein